MTLGSLVVAIPIEAVRVALTAWSGPCWSGRGLTQRIGTVSAVWTRLAMLVAWPRPLPSDSTTNSSPP